MQKKLLKERYNIDWESPLDRDLFLNCKFGEFNYSLFLFRLLTNNKRTNVLEMLTLYIRL